MDLRADCGQALIRLLVAIDGIHFVEIIEIENPEPAGFVALQFFFGKGEKMSARGQAGQDIELQQLLFFRRCEPGERSGGE